MGSVVFLHADGTGLSHWNTARLFWQGPDGELNWDRLPQVALYRGHVADSLTSTSEAGGTIHAYGVKVPAASFGTDGKQPGRPLAASGRRASLMHEAVEAGMRTGLVNSGSIIEPGTACFVASSPQRSAAAEIARQVVESGVDIILSGGEEWFLPAKVAGRHGRPGRREDGVDLVQRARELGYTVVYDRRELEAVPDGTRRVLGIFAAEHTFNAVAESAMREMRLPPYAPEAPTLAEMTRAALRLLAPGPFFLVVEEEGTDNFGNNNNGVGTLEALKRADDALGVALDFLQAHPETLLLTAADSVAGAMDAVGFVPSEAKTAVVRNGRDRNGAPYSRQFPPDPEKPWQEDAFLSAPDERGVRHPFVITWGTLLDSCGGLVVRAAGRGSERVRGSLDNTGVYAVMRSVLFDQDSPETSAAKPSR